MCGQKVTGNFHLATNRVGTTIHTPVLFEGVSEHPSLANPRNGPRTQKQTFYGIFAWVVGLGVHVSGDCSNRSITEAVGVQGNFPNKLSDACTSHDYIQYSTLTEKMPGVAG